jgi:hypothetical protein
MADNAYERAGYRFHDVFHLAFAAVLGWSPITRALLKRKRKSSPEVDEVEDRGRSATPRRRDWSGWRSRRPGRPSAQRAGRRASLRGAGPVRGRRATPDAQQRERAEPLAGRGIGLAHADGGGSRKGARRLVGTLPDSEVARRTGRTVRPSA